MCGWASHTHDPPAIDAVKGPPRRRTLDRMGGGGARGRGGAWLVLVLVAAACAGGTDRTAVGPSIAATEDCAAAARQQVDDVLAAFEDRDPGTLEQLSALTAVEDCPAFDAEAAAAALDAEARQLLPGIEAEDGSIHPDVYVRLTALAMVASALRPSPRYDVPDGFPPELPVAEGAELVEVTRDVGGMSARWEVAADRGYEAVADVYADGLQQGVPGRWSVSGSSGGVMADGGTAVSGDQAWEVTGYGYAGTVRVRMAEGADVITVEATLAPAPDPAAEPGAPSATPAAPRRG